MSEQRSGGGGGMRECVHCGTPYRAGAGSGDFCCSGCEYVHGLITGGDLGRFYDLKGGRRLSPAGSRVLRPGAFAWLAPLASASERDGAGRLTLALQGVSCIGCVWLVERLFADWPGALEAKVRATSGNLELTWKQGACDLPGFAAHLQRFGYTLAPPRDSSNAASTSASPESRALIWRIGLCAAFAMNAMLFTLPSYLGMHPASHWNRLFDAMTMLFATGAFLAGGSYFIARAWRALRAGSLHIDLPIALGLVIAYAASLLGWALGQRAILYFDFVAVFAFLMLGGRWLQQRAIDLNRSRLAESGVRLEPVRRLDPETNSATEIDPATVAAGERIEVPPGAHVPVRSRLDSDSAALSLAWINGESEPRQFTRGRTLPSGARNLAATPLVCHTLESWRDSLLAALLDVTERDNPRDAARERVIGVYLALVIVVAAGGGACWLAAGSWLGALQVAVSVLVVSCPCSLGVALPFAEEFAVSQMRRHGVFVRRQDVFSRLGGVDAVMLDKTGTLTLDEMQLENRAVLAGLDARELSALAQLSGASLHPASLAIHDAVVAAGGTPAGAGSHRVRELPGLGVELEDEHARWRLGRPQWAGQPGQRALAEATSAFSRDGATVAEFLLRESVRDEARAQVATLRRRGHDVWILSGDRQSKVDAMARALGVDPRLARGDLSPEDKAGLVAAHGAGRVCLLGDGANDSLAFREAGCTGTPAIDRGLLENQSDFYFTGRSLAGLGRLFEASDRHRHALRAALAFAIAYNVVAVGICLAGLMNPLVAAILMPISSVVTLYIVWRAIRLRGRQERDQPPSRPPDYSPSEPRE